MKFPVTLFIMFFAISGMAQKKQADLIRELELNRITLPDGSKITPAGKSLQTGGVPSNLTVSNSEKFMALGNRGQNLPSIQLIDLRSDNIFSTVAVPGGWCSFKFSQNDKFLFASARDVNKVFKYSVSLKELILIDSFTLEDKDAGKILPVGIEVDERSNRLFVVTKGDNSLYIIDLKKKLILKKLDLGGEAYTCLLDKYSSTLFISVWGSDRILLINTISMQVITSITVGGNPNEMTQSSNGKFLYVANAKDNSVSIIDLTQQKVIEVLDGNLNKDDPSGNSANGLALNKEESRLYFTNSYNNCLAVFDITRPGNSLAIGFIPVGWKPNSVKVVKRKIYVTNEKGLGSEKEQGTMSILPEPGPEDLGVFTTITYRNIPVKKESE